MAVSVKTIVTWDVTPDSLADIPYYFERKMRNFQTL